MRFVLTAQGWEDYVNWQRTDRTVLKRVNRLIDDVVRDPTLESVGQNNSGLDQSFLVSP